VQVSKKPPTRLVRAGRCRPDQVRDDRRRRTKSGIRPSRSRFWSQPPSPRRRRCSADSTRPRCTRRDGRAQRGRAGRRRHRRGAQLPRTRCAWSGSGGRPCEGRRRRGHRDDRRARRGRGRGPRLDRGARAHPGEHQRRRAGRRGRTLEQLAAFAADPPAKARLRPLQWPGRSTPGTWPRRWTRCARRPLPSRSAIRCCRCCPTRTAPQSRAARTGWSASSNQVSAPVRWNLCMRTMTDLEAGALIELPPAGTLTGLARRGDARCGAGRPEDPRRPPRGHQADRRARCAGPLRWAAPTTVTPRSGGCWSRRWPARSAPGRPARAPTVGAALSRARRSGTSSSAADGT